MHRRGRAHRQGIANTNGRIAGAHSDERYSAAVFFREAQPFFYRARGSRIELVRHPLARHALGIRIDFDGYGTGGNHLTADNNVQCASPYLKTSAADKQTKAPVWSRRL